MHYTPVNGADGGAGHPIQALQETKQAGKHDSMLADWTWKQAAEEAMHTQCTGL